jgi:HrpA-like RNA helicase
MSILEQRQSLPIYKLKDELIKAINDNQVWFFCQNISIVQWFSTFFWLRHL